MEDVEQLLKLSKKVVQSACDKLAELNEELTLSYEYSGTLPREMKAVADKVMEDEILSQLMPVGLPILSEERGEVDGNTATDLRFIVDPLDGTVNFVRKLGSAAVCVALYKGSVPVFGVIGVSETNQVAWGGREIGAFLNQQPITVSGVEDIGRAVICTGFPSRFEFDDDQAVQFLQNIKRFAKVRMLGAASISLLQVAKGSADLYSERDIMLWDVAAGLALVEGAGGVILLEPGSVKYSYNVSASNGFIDNK